jgi:hypothetical protein
MRSRRRDEVYEVTILGRLGPACLRALGCQDRAHAGDEVIVRAVVTDETDLVELLRRLENLNLQVTGVAEVA